MRPPSRLLDSFGTASVTQSSPEDPKREDPQ